MDKMNFYLFVSLISLALEMNVVLRISYIFQRAVIMGMVDMLKESSLLLRLFTQGDHQSGHELG